MFWLLMGVVVIWVLGTLCSAASKNSGSSKSGSKKSSSSKSSKPSDGPPWLDPWTGEEEPMYGATTLVDDQLFPQFDAAYKISERYNVHPDFRVDRS